MTVHDLDFAASNPHCTDKELHEATEYVKMHAAKYMGVFSKRKDALPKPDEEDLKKRS